jgi:hypothetical protein
MLDEVQDQIQPTLSAVAVLTRLKSTYPEQFTDRHVRTVQRAVKVWRAHQAHRIILQSATAITAGIGDPLPSGDVIPSSPGSTATPRASLRQARGGHSAMRGSPLWTPWTTRRCRDTRPSVTFPCEATCGVSLSCRPTASATAV